MSIRIPANSALAFSRGTAKPPSEFFSGCSSALQPEQRAFYYDGKDIDELETKIHAVEHELYPLVVKKMCEEN